MGARSRVTPLDNTYTHCVRALIYDCIGLLDTTGRNRSFKLLYRELRATCLSLARLIRRTSRGSSLEQRASNTSSSVTDSVSSFFSPKVYAQSNNSFVIGSRTFTRVHIFLKNGGAKIRFKCNLFQI